MKLSCFVKNLDFEPVAEIRVSVRNGNSAKEIAWPPEIVRIGKVHPGETERQAALRETEEEAGIRPDQMILYEQFRTELHYHVRNKPKTVIYGLAELKDPQFEVKFSREHQDMKWLSFEDAYNIAKNEGMRNALNEANKFISAS